MKINFKGIRALVLLLLLITTGCKQDAERIEMPSTDLARAALIPIPAEIKASHSAFPLDQNTYIQTEVNDTLSQRIAGFLAADISKRFDLELPINPGKPGRYVIYLFYTGSSEDPNEAYSLDIGRDTLLLSATSPAGLFRGIQTVRQLIPEVSNDTLTDHPIWLIPTGGIEDKPLFPHRAGMLDVSRHFFSVEEVKKYLDILAYYKLNTLHLHLSDDQGWRIEIKSWPRLTEIGGSTEVGGEGGGFYTQEEYREIIEYAADRYITIIPEIDMPGHTNAASVSYPFLDGTGKPLKLYEGTRVGFSSFDTRKDTVYGFIDDVVREISALSPGPYFHIGGDESHSTKSSDYKYFVKRVSGIVDKYGKRMIGWDEIANCDVDSTAIVQFWANESNAQKAAQKGMQVILSPAKKAYLDMKYDSLSVHGLDWAGHIPVDTAYLWSPRDYVKGLQVDKILGIEAPLWSETISNSAELEYLAIPRLLGYAELGWSADSPFDWEDYARRLAGQTQYFRHNNINYYRAPEISWGD